MNLKTTYLGSVLLITSSILLFNQANPTQAATATSSTEISSTSSRPSDVTTSSSTSSVETSSSSSSSSSQSSSTSSESKVTSSSASTHSTSQTPTTEKNSKTPVAVNKTLGPGFYEKTVQSASTFSLSRSNLLRSSNTTNFLNQIKAGTLAAWHTYHVLPSVSAAQAILESGWGQSTLSTSAHNLFGIKGTYNGQSVTMPTQEYVNGQYITINAAFRKYPSVAESIADHGAFLNNNSRYSNLLGVTDYQKVAQLLQADGYATSPTYTTSLIRIIEEYNLDDWDKEAIGAVTASSLDRYDILNGRFNAFGWTISPASVGKPYSYVFAMDATTGKEIMRWNIGRITRPDVGAKYPNTPNSSKSGFAVFTKMSAKLFGKKIHLLVRYSSDPHGNYNASDEKFAKTIVIPTQGTVGSLDQLVQKGNSVSAFGWQLGQYTQSTPYRFILVNDAKTGKVLAKKAIGSFTRADVASKYPTWSNPSLGGFNASVPINAQMKHKTITVTTRYTDAADGNGHNIDYTSKKQITLK